MIDRLIKYGERGRDNETTVITLFALLGAIISIKNIIT